MSAEGQAEGSGINMSDLATSMRHSTREQARTYDRRMVGEKVSAVVARAANEVNSVLGVKTPGPNPGVEMEMDTVDAESEYCPEVGDIVAVVEDASTEQRPVIILGKVIRVFAKEKESLLAWLRPYGNRLYRLVVGTDSWRESWDSLIHPIDITYDVHSNLYTLRTPTVDLHKYIHS